MDYDKREAKRSDTGSFRDKGSIEGMSSKDYIDDSDDSF